jgi:hypothetical protein
MYTRTNHYSRAERDSNCVYGITPDDSRLFNVRTTRNGCIILILFFLFCFVLVDFFFVVVDHFRFFFFCVLSLVYFFSLRLLSRIFLFFRFFPPPSCFLGKKKQKILNWTLPVGAI